MTQTIALLVDAYRELNAKKLFWFSLIISALVVVAIAGVGLYDRGITILWFEIPIGDASDMYSFTKIIPKPLFYKLLFSSIGIKLWLTWAATILALVSTASMIPDFVSSGSIELTLSKPIHRVRLLMTKFVAGLLFVGLQVAVFSAACFIAIGIRSGAWEPRLFLAIPIVVVFFTYLYSVCLLVGLITRSTIAALLITIIFWLALAGLNAADAITLDIKSDAQAKITRLEPRIERMERAAADQIKRDRANAPADQAASTPVPADAAPTQAELDIANPLLPARRADLVNAHANLESLRKWNRLFVNIKTFFPKTSETIGLLERSLISSDDTRRILNAQRGQPDEDPEEEGDRRGRNPDAAQIMDDALRSRSVLWIVGTSLIFEAVILGIACWYFARKDY